MKIAFGIIAFLVSSFSYANDCRLENPIDLRGINPLETKVLLVNAEFDNAPTFPDEGVYDPDSDQLKTYLFNIVWNKVETGYLGAGIWVSDTLASVGFSFNYGGNFNFFSSVDQRGDKTTYFTNQTSVFTEPHHAPREAIKELTVTIENGFLTSYKIQIPIFKRRVVDGNASYLSFTGKHETLCLLNATRH